MAESSNRSLEFRNDFPMNNLDDYSLWKIFSYLSLDEILEVEEVCNRWKILCQEWWKQIQSFQCTDDSGFNSGLVYNWKLLDKNLERVFYSGRDEEKLKKILQSCGHFITTYHLKINSLHYGMDYATAAVAFKLIPQLCKNIVTVNVEFKSLTIPRIRFMTECWTKLETFSFPAFTAAMEKDLNLLLKNNKLKVLSLRYLYQYELQANEFFEQLRPDVIEELHLDIRHIETPSFDSFISVSKNFKCLRSLALEGFICLSNIMAETIGNIETLTDLSLAKTEDYETDTTINHVAKLVNLRKLDLSCTKLLDENLIGILKSCKELEILNISDCQSITDRGLTGVTELRRLKTLMISDIRGISEDLVDRLIETIQFIG